MAGLLIGYLAAAIMAASHVAGAPSGAQPALAARPLRATVVLRAEAHGRPLVRVGPRGALGGPLVLGVVAVRGSWVEVTAEALPNGEFGWAKFGRDVVVHPVRWALRVSLDRRRLVVLHGARVVRTIRVAVGAASTPTPPGRFAIAEKLSGAFGPPYGCCIIGLTARQPRLPAGWNRRLTYYVAIHGGSGMGSAVSAGCLHASQADLRYLMRTIPLGTPVLVSR